MFIHEGHHLVVMMLPAFVLGHLTQKSQKVFFAYIGHNRYSIGICYKGGLNSAGEAEYTRTFQQVRALRQLVERYHAYFPDAVILGHQNLNPGKDCPCFDAVKEYWNLQPVR